MAQSVSSMFLYGLTLQRSSQITLAVHGQFSGTKQQVLIIMELLWLCQISRCNKWGWGGEMNFVIIGSIVAVLYLSRLLKCESDFMCLFL